MTEAMLTSVSTLFACMAQIAQNQQRQHSLRLQFLESRALKYAMIVAYIYFLLYMTVGLIYITRLILK